MNNKDAKSAEEQESKKEKTTEAQDNKKISRRAQALLLIYGSSHSVTLQ